MLGLCPCVHGNQSTDDCDGFTLPPVDARQMLDCDVCDDGKGDQQQGHCLNFSEWVVGNNRSLTGHLNRRLAEVAGKNDAFTV